MSRRIFEIRDENRSKSKSKEKDKEKMKESIKINQIKESHQKHQEVEFDSEEQLSYSNSWEPNITTTNFEIEEEEDFGLEEYKSEIDGILKEKEEKIKKAYEFERDDKEIEEKIKRKMEKKFKESMTLIKESSDNLFEREKKDLDEKYEEQLENEKKRIEEEVKKELEKCIKNNEEKNEQEKEIEKLEEEIGVLERKLKEITASSSKLEPLSPEKELSSLESELKEDLLSFEDKLNSQIKEKEKENSEKFEREKTEISRKRLIEKQKEEDLNLNLRLENEDEAIENQKKLLVKNNEAKLEHFKTNLIIENNREIEVEKQEILSGFQNDLEAIEKSHEKTQLFYELQKLIFEMEQKALSANSFLDKVKHFIENKNNVLKNLMDKNFFIIKKKLRECDEIKELESYNNREIILQKISGIFNMLFYSIVYGSIQNDLENERSVMVGYSNDLLKKSQDVVSNVDSERKLQLQMYLLEPNFT